MDNMWDCNIVGGGAAGLSAGLVLGRARRRTLLVDAGAQSNLAAHGIGGLIGHDGRSPCELYDIGRESCRFIRALQVRSGEVGSGERSDGGFVLELADGSRERTRRVLLATGMDYRPPSLPGLDQLWGGSAFHCPFCHGWEMRDQPLGVLARTGVLVATTLHQRSTLADQLGAEAAEPTPVAENPIAVDGFYRTTAAGVFAAGDLSVQMPQVATAIASGSHAAAAVVQSLMADEYGLAVPEGSHRVNA
ncbi:MAG: NAD(P)/FAD-dependent oxidoreductase [Mycobacterium sp.]